MRATVPPPLFGYNSTVRRNGRSFHVQTEDSGLGHPHVITHVFAEGGRIVATHRTSYADHVGSPECAAIVRRLLVTQHREAFIALHEGRYDLEGTDATAPMTLGVELVQTETMPPQAAANDAVRAERAPERAATAIELLAHDPMAESLDDVIVRDVALSLR